MREPRLDKHDKIHHELFDEDTNEVRSLGDIVDKHAGDAVFLGPTERGNEDADGGEEEFVDNMLPTDPAEDDGMEPDDLYSVADERQVWATDQTGTVEGIARGFGTHMAQDLGKDGFQVEEIPDIALQYQSRPVNDGEELDDYDDDADGSRDDAGPALARASEPGANALQGTPDTEPTPDRIPVTKPRATTTDEQLDATRRIR